MTQARARIGDLVRVEWQDAWVDHDESEVRDWKDAMPVSTLGYLLRDRPVVSVAAERLPDGKYRCVTHIPRSIVEKVEVIRRGDR